MLYFSYGSNMSSKRLRMRAPSATFVAVAELSAHILRFHKKSDRDGSAKCDAYHTGDDAHRLFGVVFRVDAAHLPLLDKAEGSAGAMRKSASVFALLAARRLTPSPITRRRLTAR